MLPCIRDFMRIKHYGFRGLGLLPARRDSPVLGDKFTHTQIWLGAMASDTETQRLAESGEEAVMVSEVSRELASDR
jgi:hypothetical protein